MSILFEKQYLVSLVRQPIGTTPQPIAFWHIFFHNKNKFRTFLFGREITDSHRMMDSAVLFHKSITTGKHQLE